MQVSGYQVADGLAEILNVYGVHTKALRPPMLALGPTAGLFSWAFDVDLQRLRGAANLTSRAQAQWSPGCGLTGSGMKTNYAATWAALSALAALLSTRHCHVTADVRSAGRDYEGKTKSRSRGRST